MPEGCIECGLAGQHAGARLAGGHAVRGLLLGGLLIGLGPQASLPSLGACDQRRYEGSDHPPVICLQLLARDALPQLIEVLDGELDEAGRLPPGWHLSMSMSSGDEVAVALMMAAPHTGASEVATSG
jgi:hypothetical protein